MKYYNLSDVDVNNKPWSFCISRKTNSCFTATVEEVKFTDDGRQIATLRTANGKSYTMVIEN